ncbi:hypothetical protein GCM10007973_10030 [Polymorphobacter multimanifer]|uniref:Uncharacterized protein n=1 Tax=Polymorphobacter multimanifer TaxID=1070431 RepID=A0A841L5F0_9SPHN|nr:hypothetical protein [Polymorphobacter multimanifer]MBB6227650.1 hypothetical protein [Polymorphobacter multimanifer]GGI75180.1 hypothetical protein GCM10007973_10030 [Polymorphobacter multimanifer]
MQPRSRDRDQEQRGDGRVSSRRDDRRPDSRRAETGGGETQRAEAPRADVPRADVPRADVPRAESGRAEALRPERRPAAPRQPIDVDESPIPGLPGPARLSTRSRRIVEEAVPAPAELEPVMVMDALVAEAPQAEPAADGDEAPAPRRRGRPRKVVA